MMNRHLCPLLPEQPAQPGSIPCPPHTKEPAILIVGVFRIAEEQGFQGPCAQQMLDLLTTPDTHHRVAIPGKLLLRRTYTSTGNAVTALQRKGDLAE